MEKFRGFHNSGKSAPISFFKIIVAQICFPFKNFQFSFYRLKSFQQLQQIKIHQKIIKLLKLKVFRFLSVACFFIRFCSPHY